MALRTRTLELDVIARSDATLVVSDVERTLLATDAPGAQVEILSNLHQIAGAGHPFAHREDLVFVGGFRHPPNVDAVRWFVEAIFPAVRARLPNVRFHCIGSHATDAILALRQVDGVVVHGHVPDIDPYMRRRADRDRAAALRRRREGQGQPEHGPRATGGRHLLRGRRHASARRAKTCWSPTMRKASPMPSCACIRTKPCGAPARQRRW